MLFLKNLEIYLEKWALLFHAPSGNGEKVLQAWKTTHNNCDIVSGNCPCSISNGCLPPQARLETYKSTTKVLQSPYTSIDHRDCLNINKVPKFLEYQQDNFQKVPKQMILRTY